MTWSILFCRCRVFVAGIMLALALSNASGVNAQERRSYQLGTATTSDLPHAVGVTLAALIKLKLLPVSGIDINAQNTSGARDNIRLLQSNDLDLAILTSLDAFEIANSAALSDGGEADSGLRLLTNLWQETYHVVARKGLVPDGRFSELLKLQKIRAAFGERDSDDFAVSQALFQRYDLNIDEIFEVNNLNSQDAATAFLNDELDVFILKTAASDADLLSFLDQAGDRAVLLDVSEEDIETVNGRGPEIWSSIAIPPGRYSGQTAAQQTFAIDYQLVATASVDDEVVYQITKTIFDNLPILQGMHDATDEISLQNALRQALLPVHSGAERYYQEIGLELPVYQPLLISNLTDADFLTRYTTVQEARERLSDTNFSILGGREGQTIGRFTSELAGDLSSEALRVLGMNSPDPANNIAQVLYAKGVDSAFVPLDILNYAAEQNIYPSLQSKLVYTTELFPQEFHLITTRDIDDIEDLTGKAVNLGTRDSGSAFTASFLFDELNIPVEPAYFEPRQALNLLKRGELAAVILVAGKPMPLLQQSGVADGLRFLDVPTLDGTAYRSAAMTSADYPGLLDAGETVETFSVRTALITYNWRTNNPRYAALSTFISAFFNRLSSLKDDSADLHPKWQDINPFAELEGWRRFSAAQSWLNSGQSNSGQDNGPEN